MFTVVGVLWMQKAGWEWDAGVAALPRFNFPSSCRLPFRSVSLLASPVTPPPPSSLQRGTGAVTALIDKLCFDGSERDGREIGAAAAVSAGIPLSFLFPITFVVSGVLLDVSPGLWNAGAPNNAPY